MRRKHSKDISKYSIKPDTGSIQCSQRGSKYSPKYSSKRSPE